MHCLVVINAYSSTCSLENILDIDRFGFRFLAVGYNFFALLALCLDNIVCIFGYEPLPYFLKER